MIKITEVKEVTPIEVEEMLQANKEDIILVDVREQEEVDQGIIKEAIHIPLNEIPEAYINFDQNKHYIMVCRSGQRSHNAAAFLQERGINVSNMVGGMLEWEGEIK